MKKSQLKLIIRECLREIMNDRAVGFHEMMQFYSNAPKEKISEVETLLEKGNSESAWQIVKHFLETAGLLISKSLEEDVNEMNWKKALGTAAVVGSTLLGSPEMTAKEVPVKTQSQPSSLFIDYMKKVENSVKSGFKDGRWYPHKSIEGGSPTIAYGHKVLAGEDFSKGLTEKEATDLLKRDIESKEKLARNRIPNYNKYPDYVRNAIINALFRGDMGPKTLGLINSGKWDSVATEYLNHENYKSGKYKQIKDRMNLNADAFSRYAKELKK